MIVRKFAVTGVIAIDGKQKDFSKFEWAKSGTAAKKLAIIKYKMIKAVSTVQVYSVEVVPGLGAIDNGK